MTIIDITFQLTGLAILTVGAFIEYTYHHYAKFVGKILAAITFFLNFFINFDL